jgi:hypothetical protein
MTFLSIALHSTPPSECGLDSLYLSRESQPLVDNTHRDMGSDPIIIIIGDLW